MKFVVLCYSDDNEDCGSICVLVFEGLGLGVQILRQFRMQVRRSEAPPQRLLKQMLGSITNIMC